MRKTGVAFSGGLTAREVVECAESVAALRTVADEMSEPERSAVAARRPGDRGCAPAEAAVRLPPDWPREYGDIVGPEREPSGRDGEWRRI